MKKPPLLVRSLVDLLLLMPLCFQVVFVVLGVAFGLIVRVFNWRGDTQIFMGIGAVVGVSIVSWICVRMGRSLVRRSYTRTTGVEIAEHDDAPKPSGYFFVRYLGVVIACAYTVLVALGAIFLPPGGGSAGIFDVSAAVLFWSHLPSSFVVMLATIFSTPQTWPYLVPPLLIYATYAAGMAWTFRSAGASRTRWQGRVVFAAILAGGTALFLWRTSELREGIVRNVAASERIDDTIYTEKYMPFREDNALAKIAQPTLAIFRDHPRLDGATALFPVYAAAAQAIYKNLGPQEVRKVVSVGTTPRAYERLIAGEVDVIFCAQPSADQIAAAKARGVELQLTPLGREAFVFFVNGANPVDGLTSEQVRAIYKRKITNWAGLGGVKASILPFQRPKNSGSQTAMEAQVMRGEKMATPLREEHVHGMGGIVLETAAYQNAANAIGYSFRFFVTTMTGAKNIKFLEIDGIAPTTDSIRDGTYPYTGNLYAVTTNKTTDKPHVQELISWFCSEQGQKLIEDSGYVALGKK